MAIVTVVTLYCRALFKPQTMNLLYVVALSMTMYCISLALVTGLARPYSGMVGRYQSVAMLFWCGILLLIAETIQTLKWSWIVTAYQTVTLLVVGTASAMYAPEIAREVRTKAAEWRRAEAAVVAGVNDYRRLNTFIVLPQDDLRAARYLQENKRSIFAEKAASSFGSRIIDFYKVRNSGCSGGIHQATRVSDPSWSGLEVTGWAILERVDTHLGHVLLVNEDGRIVGFGFRDEDGTRRANEGSADKGAEWFAYMTDRFPSNEVTAHAVLSGQEVCSLYGPQKLSAIVAAKPALTLADVAKPVPIWLPGMPAPAVSMGKLEIAEDHLKVHSTGMDTMLHFSSAAELNRFRTLVFKVWFQRQDTIEVFFGRQVDGRGMGGVVNDAATWVYVIAHVALNPYWSQEAGSILRFDPSGGLGAGAQTKIAGIWATESVIGEENQLLEFFVAKD
jgi:hypothetical protein